MSNTPELSEAKRALLEKYLRGDLPQAARAIHAVTQDTTAEGLSSDLGVLAVQPAGARLPFFFLHGQWDGMSFHCYPLAQALGSDQPFYALEPYTLTGRQALPTLEDIAAAHIKTVRGIQPEGPYLLGGWCNGGLLAYEMARQLQAEGQAVDLLILMDPVPLVYPARFRWYLTAFRVLGKLLRFSQDKQFDWYLRLKHLWRLVYSYLLYSLFTRADDSKHLAFGDLRQDYPRVFDWVALGYAPSSLYVGKVTFFWAYAGKEAKAFRKGWRKVEANGEIEVHLIPGDHITCRTDYLQVLADHLSTCIRKAQTSTSSTEGTAFL